MSNVSTSKPAPASPEKPNTAAQAKPSMAPGSPAVAHAPPPPAENKPSATTTNGSPSAPVGPAPVAESAAEGDDEKEKIQYHVIVGRVETFPDVTKAEAFLNAPEAPQCTVIYGKIGLANEWHITTGAIHSFASLVKAQKFLREPTAPKEFVMIRGRITAPEIRVSLRR
jgi:hypothetical protein